MINYSGHVGLEIRENPTETEAWKNLSSEQQGVLVKMATVLRQGSEKFYDKYKDFPSLHCSNRRATRPLEDLEYKFLAQILFDTGITAHKEGNACTQQYLLSKNYDSALRKHDEVQIRKDEQAIDDVYHASLELAEKKLGLFEETIVDLRRFIRGHSK